MAVRLGDLIKLIEREAPLELKEAWDNTGFAVGDKEAVIEKVLLSLDATEGVIAEAQENGADLLLTHHPMLFNRPDAITADNIQGKKILALVKANLNAYSAHTNLDKATGGLNEKIMVQLGLLPFENLEETEQGIGRIASIESTRLADLAAQVAAKLMISELRFVGDPDFKVQRVAVINGGGADYMMLAKAAGADCLITGDTKYHEVLDALEAGIAVIDPGHFALEWQIFKLAMEELHQKILAELGAVEFIYSKTARDPYRFYTTH